MGAVTFGPERISITSVRLADVSTAVEKLPPANVIVTGWKAQFSALSLDPSSIELG